MSDLLFSKAIDKKERYMFLAFIGCSLISLFAGIALDAPVLFGLPFAIILAFVAIADFRNLFYLMLLILPFSIEIYLPNGLGIDLPAEPLMMLMTGVVCIYLLSARKIPGLDVFRHPITALILLHLAWILISGINAEYPVVGIKVFAAKLWFIIPFFLLPVLLYNDRQFYEKIFWTLISIMLLCILYVNVRHGASGFSFAEINSSVSPFFRNHVNYGAVLVVLLPFIWAMYFRYTKKPFLQNILSFIFIIFLVAIYLTYTRAAQGAVLIAAGVYFIVRFRLVKYVLGLGLILAIFVVQSVFTNNEYIYMAPDFEKTVSHEKFDNLIEATVKMEDISTMERLHRWVAGYHMVREKPWIGFGPGNFYPTYKPYTVYSFETYVSDNPDKSGVHNYYLMTLVEQGFIGLLVLMILITAILLKGESLYHKIRDKDRKRLVMASLMSIIVILSIMLVNDLLESLKVGSLFWLFVSFIVIEDLRERRRKSGSVEKPVQG